MPDEKFEPLIEGEIGDNRNPIFAKALTYGTRVIRLPNGFTKRKDHLQEARRLVLVHYEDYAELSLARVFPIRYYNYFISATRAARISVSGEILGIFEDAAANPSFVLVEGNGTEECFHSVES